MTGKTPFLLALSASLLLAGCQSQSASPIAPNAAGVASLAARGGGGGGGGGGTLEKFTFVFAGDLVGNSAFRNRTKSNTTQLEAPFPNDNFDTSDGLDVSFLAGEGLGGCFDSVGAVPGQLYVKLERDGSYSADFYFEAPNKNDDATIRYRLSVFGDGVGTWLGAQIDITLDTFEMKVDTKGSRKSACTGSGSLSAATPTIINEGQV